MLALAACAPIAWQSPPGAPPQAFGMDDAGCKLTAEGMNPAGGPYYGRPGAVLAASLVNGLAAELARRNDYVLCMQSRGYTAAPEPGAVPLALTVSSPGGYAGTDTAGIAAAPPAAP
jgi:hypothetical protein